jgi:GNAT superfamily N-acetyltransferase
MTDVLGRCESWVGGQVVVRRDDGVAVVIPEAEIVAGKPVPPRPSIRARVSPAEAQRRAMALFPDLVTVPLGSWVLRSSQSSHARRANSVLAIGPTPTADPVPAVTAHYEGLGRRPVAMVLPGSAEAAVFEAAGWVPESRDADSVFQIAGVAHALRALRSVGDLPVELVTSGAGSAQALFRDDGGRVVARALVVYWADWVGVATLAVEPPFRRRGLASALLAEVLEWGAMQGARTAYLQVLGDNAPALALYSRLGFVTHHAYRYLAAPARPPADR